MDGQTIDHYKLLEKLGAGGMGEIYKAEDTRLHRVVAIKILSPAVAADPERRKRFLQEAQAASALNHPNIITVYDIVSEAETQCMVMEYVAGKTLRDVIPAGGLPVAQALQYAVQIASALGAAHIAGIIHRDLKPSNIMITPSNLVKILDFGLAKFLDPLPSSSEAPTVDQAQLTREGSILGTVSYMSPEQAEGKRVDARSDIFAFGSVLYEMLTGKRAFEGTSGISTLSAILRDEVKPIYEIAPDVPPLLEQIVLRCLQKDPGARWQSMQQVAGALNTLQRQLDPSGQYAPPLSTSALSAAPLAVPASPVSAVPAPAASPVSVPVGGPEAPVVSSIPSPASATAPGTKPPSKLPPPQPGPSKLLALMYGVLGLVLLAGAGAGGWYLWKTGKWNVQNKPAQTANVQPAIPKAPENPPATIPVPTAPEATTPAAPNAAPSAPAETPAPAAKKRARVAKKTVPVEKNVAPPPVAAPAPAPPPPSAPPPKAVEPAPPKAPPARPIQMVPILVGDGLPFRMTLADDVPLNAAEGTPVRFTVAEDFVANNKVVIAKGATVTGEVAVPNGKKKFLGIGGNKMAYELQKVDAADGKKLNVRGTAGRNADGPVLHAFETPNGRKAKGYAALKGTEYIGYTEGDQTVSVRK